MDISRLISDRARAIDASGIRRVFDLGARLERPINLSIGQPDFAVPEAIKRAAIEAVAGDHNGYTVTQGIPALHERISEHLRGDVGWTIGDEAGLLVTSGTSGAIMLALLAILGPGDEIIIPDPYFVAYPHVATMCGGKAVRCDTYPDFRLTAERVEPLITERTKAVLLNSPSNPAGAVADERTCRELLALCRERGVLLIADEIYDEFTYADARTQARIGGGELACPSPSREAGSAADMLLVRGFGKTYAVTGWRMAYAAGPRELIEQMGKLQQYTFVCAPAPAQWGCVAALDTDMGAHVADYQRRRNLVVERLGAITELAPPGGAFYAFPRVPEGMTGTSFADECIRRQVLVIPGGVFSDRDTHIRISFATDAQSLERGLDALVDLFSQ